MSPQAPAPAAAAAARPFGAAELASARAAGGRLLDALAELEPVAHLRAARLAATCGLPLAGHARLMSLAPDFDAVPFETALRRECVALRDE
ncbi:MAG: type II/IV secretion system protein, partial [Betaproteobacteria bacterium]